MPILNSQLNARGHAIVDLVVVPDAIRRRAVTTAGQRPPTVQAQGLIDTGATFTAIDLQVRQQLNLAPFRIRRVTVPGAQVPRRVFTYKVDLFILGPTGNHFYCPSLSVVETRLTQLGVEILVGCDVLAKCQFDHHGSAGTFSLAY
jgi:hypothetical protein